MDCLTLYCDEIKDQAYSPNVCYLRILKCNDCEEIQYKTVTQITSTRRRSHIYYKNKSHKGLIYGLNNFPNLKLIHSDHWIKGLHRLYNDGIIKIISGKKIYCHQKYEKIDTDKLYENIIAINRKIPTKSARNY